MLIWIAWMANFSLKLEAIMGSGRKVGLYVISNWFFFFVEELEMSSEEEKHG